MRQASVRYEQLFAEAKADLSRIDELLTNHCINSEPYDWFDVGELEHAATLLSQAAGYLQHREERKTA